MRRRIRGDADGRRDQLSAGRRLTMRYLHRADLSIAEIACLVGYDDIAAFYKAFKQWTGSTPAEQRARFQNVGGADDARVAHG